MISADVQLGENGSEAASVNGERRQYGIFTIRDISGEELGAFVADRLVSLGEDEAIAVLSNRFCAPSVCVAIAGNSRLASYYEVKQKLVTCRATPQHLALKFVRHLYWSDLVHGVEIVGQNAETGVDNAAIHGIVVADAIAERTFLVIQDVLQRAK